MKDIVKEKIAGVLGLTDEWEDGTYLYHLTRVKSAFGVGTMTLDDFVEIDHDLVDEVYEAIKPFIEAKEIVINTPSLPESEYIKQLQHQINTLQLELFNLQQKKNWRL